MPLNPNIIMILETKRRLHNGIEIPQLGLGTWKASVDEAADIVRNGVKLGYTHFDTAIANGNEEGVGEGINTCGLERNRLFITSKIPAEVKNYSEAADAIRQSIKRLRTDYIDLMLIHWPKPWDESAKVKDYSEENRQVWKAMEEAYDAGILRSIGVSNFTAADIDNLTNNCRVKPMVNQILANVNVTPTEMLAYCKENDIIAESYSPNGNGNILSDERLIRMAGKYGVSVPQLCIRYTLRLGMVSIPKTTNVQHMADNAKVDFVISDEDMAVISEK